MAEAFASRSSQSDQLDPRARRAWRIAFISFAILVLELSLIRLVPAQVQAISYFTNLLFMAAFTGLGLGCILQRHRSLAWTLPLGLVLLCAFVHVGRGIVIFSEAHDVHYWLGDPSETPEALKLPLFPAALAAFLLGACPFVALGQQLARSMDRHPRLVAYGWDIAGSLAGTLFFAVCSFLGLPPWIWPPVLGLAWAMLFVRRHSARMLVSLAGLPFLLLSRGPLEAAWSPYYYIQHQREERGLRVFVNSSFHQYAIDFHSQDPAHQEVQQRMLHKWSLPYDAYRELHHGRSPERVLVLGAGTGNDVHVARVNGAKQITAVEIDPVILRLGRERNPTKPYADPRVRVINDDARHYLEATSDKFDLVVFGTLDSQSLLSSHANLRLENYIYTAEGLTSARRALVDDGMVALYYSVFKPWLYARIYSTVQRSFGKNLNIYLASDAFLFNTVIVASKEPGLLHSIPQVDQELGHALPSVDDWPFIYLERPTLAPVYLKLFVAVGALMLLVFALLRRIHPVRGLHGNFFLLGLGFTLMESSAIVRLALLFGSTWIVNAVVFAAVLSTIWLANLAVLRRWAPSLTSAWLLLAVFILGNYLLPLEPLLELESLPRVVASGLLIGIPVFFAAVCFSRLFERQAVTGYALGVNLVGAMGGGLVEYSSMVLGMRSVWLLVLLVYLAAWLLTRVTESIRESRAAAPMVEAESAN